ncbi:DUF2786 domain-containing protein [Variovorax boronicumulans]|uniref:DUF2786 domain-containing protein n=1 Tax=Variovorax boronicumulans TaxID=436515 RepID=UPI001C59C0B4
MNRDDALKKIKKCLALAKSTNPNEAGIAMRQAQRLMAEHGVSLDDVALSDVSVVKCSTRTNSQPRWEVSLARMIAEAFGCDLIWLSEDRMLGSRRVIHREVAFIGIASAPQVAAYAWDVLSRQCAKARLAHLRKQPARCKPITLTARGDEFAMGWVHAAHQLLDAFANSERNVLLIEQYKAQTWPDSTTFKAKDRTIGRNVTTTDRAAGFVAGLEAQLNRGVGGVPERALLA